MMAAKSSAYYQIHFAQSFNNLILLRSYLAYLTKLVLAVQLGVATVLEKLQGCAVCVQPLHVVSLPHAGMGTATRSAGTPRKSEEGRK